MNNNIKSKELLEILSSRLKVKSSLEGYEFSKNNKTLKQSVNDGYYKIELNTYLSFDSERKEVSNEIIPYYYRKFDVLHNWFKKYTALSNADFNSRASIFEGGGKLGFTNQFHFLVNCHEFEVDYLFFESELIKTEKVFFNKFLTLESLYQHEALPIISNKDHKFHFHESEDLFVLLRLVYIVAPEHFEDLNNRVYIHYENLVVEEHPHAIIQFPMYNDIIKDLKDVKIRI